MAESTALPMRLLGTAVAILALAGGVIGYRLLVPQRAAPELDGGIVYSAPRDTAPVQLLRHDGKPFQPAMVGKWTFAYFGYTYCPDVCPVSMTVLGEVSRQLAAQERAESTGFLFVTLDPGRDDLARLTEYTAFFGPRFDGVTGDPAVINQFATSVGVAYLPPSVKEETDYTVSHSDNIYLLDPTGRVAGVFRPPHHPDILLRYLDAISAQPE